MQDPLNYESEKVAEHLRFVDGLAWSHMGFLAVADVRQRKIFKLGADTHPPVLRDNNGGVSGLAYDAQGRLYMCESEGRRVTRFAIMTASVITELQQQFEQLLNGGTPQEDVDLDD